MNIVSAAILLGVFLMIYGIMIEVFTVLFQLTGITREKARTQVISLLTNCGYTTSESEVIMSAKRRRALARVTMLCGYSFAVIIVSMLVNIFFAMNSATVHNFLSAFLLIGVFVAAYFLATRLKRVRRAFDSLIERMGSRVMFGEESNVLVLIDNMRENAIVEILLNHVPPCLEHKKLLESSLKEVHKIQILAVKRGDSSLATINGDTIIHQDDTLLVFGAYKEIRAVFERVSA